MSKTAKDPTRSCLQGFAVTASKPGPVLNPKLRKRGISRCKNMKMHLRNVKIGSWQDITTDMKQEQTPQCIWLQGELLFSGFR